MYLKFQKHYYLKLKKWVNDKIIKLSKNKYHTNKKYCPIIRDVWKYFLARISNTK